MTSRKKLTKSKSLSKRTQIDLGRTANTRIVIDTTPDKLTKEYVAKTYQQRSKAGRYRDADAIPRGTPYSQKTNYHLRIQDDPQVGLNKKFRHGFPHAISLVLDRRTYLQLQRFAHQEVRTPTGAVRQLIIEAVKSVVLDPTINIAKEEELLNAS